MDQSCDIIVGSVRILKETHKIFFKNGKLIASIISLTLFLYSILFLLNFFSIKPLVSSLLLKQDLLLITSPSSAEFANIIIAIKSDVGIFAQVECVFILIFSIASLVISIITIQESILAYNEKSVRFKELFSKYILRSTKRVCFTTFYITLFGLGYIILALAFLFPIILTNAHPAATILLLISSSMLYAHLAVVWTLAIVVSVLEDKHGIEALGKAAQIVKGMGLDGFLLNFVFTILSFAAFSGFSLVSLNRSTAVQILIGLIALNSICIIRMGWLIAFTVFYCQCKNKCGERVELPGGLECDDPNVIPLMDEFLVDERK